MVGRASRSINNPSDFRGGKFASLGCDPHGRPSRRSKRGFRDNFLPQEADIVRALESLYTDGLRPYGRILRKRLTEHAGQRGRVVDGDLARLRANCETCGLLAIKSEAGGEWSVLLRDRKADFVDVYSSVDPYPEIFWSTAQVYCESLTGEASILPGGRYACAQALADQQLPFFDGYSLGEINHVVQLAISQRKILGYIDGGITPYSMSNSMVKDSAAAQQSRCGHTESCEGFPVSSWDLARKHLKVILGDALSTGTGHIALSNIKHVFRSRFSLELSETALGHSKLSELLQDVRFRDICEVQLFENGYFVVPTPEEEPTTADEMSDGTQPSLDSAESWLSYRNLTMSVRHTFLHVAPMEATSRRVRRSQSVPKNFGVSEDPVCLFKRRTVSSAW